MHTRIIYRVFIRVYYYMQIVKAFLQCKTLVCLVHVYTHVHMRIHTACICVYACERTQGQRSICKQRLTYTIYDTHIIYIHVHVQCVYIHICVSSHYIEGRTNYMKKDCCLGCRCAVLYCVALFVVS